MQVEANKAHSLRQFVVAGHAGINTWSLTRVHKAGRYMVSVIAVNHAPNVKAVKASFRVRLATARASVGRHTNDGPRV